MNTFSKHLPQIIIAVVLVAAATVLAGLGTLPATTWVEVVAPVVTFVLGGSVAIAAGSSGTGAVTPVTTGVVSKAATASAPTTTTVAAVPATTTTAA